MLNLFSTTEISLLEQLKTFFLHTERLNIMTQAGKYTPGAQTSAKVSKYPHIVISPLMAFLKF